MKTLLLFFAIMASVAASGQVTKVSLQASGLTCSMCSNSIHKALKTLSFVDSVDPDIETSTFIITFKPGSNIDFEAIKQKIENAGFSVANFIASVDFKSVQVEPNKAIKVGDKTFYFLNSKKQLLTGEINVRMLNKGFLSNKEYKKNVAAIPSTEKGIYYVTI